MSEYTTLIRPDGSTLQVTGKDAEQLKAVGYQEESYEQGAARIAAEEKSKYYSGGAQGLGAFVEGALSGATFGISDQIEKGLGWDVAERAHYNPGKRFAGEIAGAIGGAFLTPTPVGLLSKGAQAVTREMGVFARAATVGAVEGAAFGAGAQVSHAALTGDPITVESMVAGAGWGAVYGAGIAGIFGGLSGTIEARAAAKRSAMEAAIEKAANPIPSESYALLRASINDAGTTINKTFKEAEAGFASLEEVGVKNMQAAQKTVNNAQLIREGFFNELELAGLEKSVAAQKKAGIAAFKEMQAALKNKDWEGVTAASDKFGEALTSINNKIYKGPTAGLPEPPAFNRFSPHSELSAKAAESAMKELGQLGAAAKTLKSLPTDAQGFATMTQAKADRMIGAVDAVMGSSAAELEGVRKALATSIAETGEKLGIAIEGTPSTQLRGIWEQTNRATKAAAKEAAANVVKEGSEAINWKRGIMNTALSPIRGILHLKGAVIGAVSNAAATWTPKAVRGLAVTGSKLEPLKVRLDGTIDGESKDRHEMMVQRAKEVREAAPGIKDTIYRAVSPLDPEHPEFAKAAYDTMIGQYNFLLNKLPTTNGLAFNRLKPFDQFDPVAMEKWSRYYAVFQNPVGVIQEALKSMRIYPESAEALREMNPALFTELRVRMMERLSDPKILNKLNYDEQVRLGTLLDIKFHSTMTPQFIANQMAMFAERAQPLNMRAQPGMSESGGRPSPTQSQQNTQH